MIADRSGPGVIAAHTDEAAVTRVLVLRGELDLAEADQLSQVLAHAVARRSGNVVLDCTEVTYLDSTAISVIHDARTELAADGWTLTLRGTHSCPRRVLELCGLHHWLADDIVAP